MGIPPDLIRRIQERAEREETFRRVGEVDLDKLIHESCDVRSSVDLLDRTGCSSLKQESICFPFSERS
jgi:hypothetical protein